LWAGDQASDFWSLRVLVVATLAAACSGVSNWSHDVGGYLGHRLVERCPPELLARWVQFGCFTPLMHAHGRMPQEPWHYGDEIVAPAPLHATPVWVRAGAIVVTYPAEHVAGGLGDVAEHERPLVATLWGRPVLGNAAARLADGTTIRWHRGEWSIDRARDVTF